MVSLFEFAPPPILPGSGNAIDYGFEQVFSNFFFVDSTLELVSYMDIS